MKTVCSINFQIQDENNARIPLMDRGFLYGDSIYEAVRTYNGKLFLFDEHFKRLLRSAQLMKLPLNFEKQDLKSHIEDLLKGVDYESYIRIIITRGEDSVFDLFPGRKMKPMVSVVIKPIHTYPDEFFKKGIKLCIVSVKRNPKAALDPEIKSGNYLNNVLAIMEAKEKGFNDALMVNEENNITESTTSNFFIVKDGTVITLGFEVGILHGITRQFLMAVMRENKISYREASIKPRDVYSADECFVTATTKEVMPVRQIDDNIIGKGEVGPMTSKLMELYRKAALKRIEP